MQMLWNQRLKYERDLLGWSQEDIAQRVGCDPKTVRLWERGESFPRPYYRQRLIKLFGKSAEELGLIKNGWQQSAPARLTRAATARSHPVLPTEAEGTLSADLAGALQAGQVDAEKRPTLEDWGEAPEIVHFFGREQEMARARSWMLAERCRVLLVLGIGGAGKTTFATRAAKMFRNEFEYIFWRSLRNAPPVEHVLESCLQCFPDQRRADLPQDLEGQLTLLLSLLRKHRCLLILDNVEAIFQAGQRTGRYIEGLSGYGSLFQRLGQTNHQSCLLMTSREKPGEIVPLEGEQYRVHSLLLPGMGMGESQSLLQDKQLVGSEQVWSELVGLYVGNPLALMLVAVSIHEMYGKDIARFLREEESVFGDIHQLVDRQFERLSGQERQVMYWLAIEREAIAVNDLWEDVKHGVSRGTLRDALDLLRRRSLVEIDSSARFTLQPVVMEYVTKRLCVQVSEEVAAETIGLLGSHPLLKAQARDDLRNSQARLILDPIAAWLLATFGKREGENRLKQMLAKLHALHPQKSGYAAGNILNLLVRLGADLRGLDLSHLPIWQAHLQGVALPEVDFAYADLSTSVFTDTFSSILCLALSPDGRLLAAGTTTSELRIWRVEGAHELIPLFTCYGHTDGIRAVAFSPDGTLLVSGSEDQSIRFWDSRSGVCLKMLEGHRSLVRSVSFSPDGKTLASGSEDETVRLWDVETGACLRILHEHTQRVRSVAFHPGGQLLASGSDDHTIRLWEVQSGQCRKILRGHTNQVRAVAFSPGGDVLASGGEDKSVRFWDVESGECRRVLHGHTNRIWAIAFSSDGRLLASGSDDRTVRVWDVETGRCQKVLQGHTNRIWSLAFLPGSAMLVSASEDQTLRFWNTDTGQCSRTVQGYTSLIKSLAFSPDGRLIADGTEEQTVQVWDVQSGRSLKTLEGHGNRVRAVAFSPDGALLVSGSEDETVRLWDVGTGHLLKTLPGHTHLVRSVAFHPGGKQIASSSYDQTIRLWDVKTGYCLKTLAEHDGIVWGIAYSHSGEIIASGGEDRTVRLWDVETGQCVGALSGHEHRVWSVAFSPDDRLLVSVGDDQIVRLWDVATQQCVRELRGHSAWTRAVAFSPDGRSVASGSHDQTVRLWDVETGACLHILRGHRNCVWSVAFGPDGASVASAGDDGTMRLWNVHTGECYKALGRERLYERMNIAHVRGLSETQKAILADLGAVEREE